MTNMITVLPSAHLFPNLTNDPLSGGEGCHSNTISLLSDEELTAARQNISYKSNNFACPIFW